jgi:glycosyltransferase involved in cell wall biosynthesis
MARLTIMHVVGCLTVGGSEQQMHALVRGLGAAGVRSLVGYLRPGTGELAAPLAALGAAPAEIALGGSLARPQALVAIGRLALRCRREGVDLLHAHDYGADLVAVAAARLAGLPVIVSRRDLGDWRPARELRLLGIACRRADRVVVNAAPIAGLAIADGVAPGRVRVIENGIDVAAFDAAAAAPPVPPPPPSARPTLAVVGNMDRPHKGHGDLLAAAARLDRPARWLILSDGPLRPALEAEVAARGLDATFLGRRRDVPAILARADGLVHPSWTEGCPNVVLEAMCARLPIVATRVGGTADLLGDAGWLVPPRDPDRLAAAIDELLEDPERARQLGAHARARVEARFAMPCTVAKVLGLYHELAPAARRRGAELAVPW